MQTLTLIREYSLNSSCMSQWDFIVYGVYNRLQFNNILYPWCTVLCSTIIYTTWHCGLLYFLCFTRLLNNQLSCVHHTQQDWEADDVIQKPPRHEVLRFLYRGKFLQGTTTLSCEFSTSFVPHCNNKMIMHPFAVYSNTIHTKMYMYQS